MNKALLVMRNSPKRWVLWGGAVILILATLAAYKNSLAAPFVFDDRAAIVDNPENTEFFRGVASGGGRSPGQWTTSGEPLAGAELPLERTRSLELPCR
ncbi:MAG: hypothetical protein QM760_02025 [Nibricoccus sp.]